MDFVDLPKALDAYGAEVDSALVIVCRLSGYVIAIPCKKKGLDAQKLARLFLDWCVALVGLPAEIMSDQDHLINSKFFTSLCQLAGVEQHTSIIYRPKGNGRAERAVQSVVAILRRTLAGSPKTWPLALPWAVFTLNDLPGADGQNSPHKIVFGRDRIALGDTPALLGPRSSEIAEKWFEQISALRKAVHDRLQREHDKIAKRFQREHQVPDFQVGYLVWVKNLPHAGTKLDPLWTGPCQILDKKGNSGRYSVTLPSGKTDVHVERLKLYLPRLDGKKTELLYFQPLLEIPEDDAFVVDRIVRHRRVDGRLEWLVKWQGYDSSFNSWEPAESFLGSVPEKWLRYNRSHKLPSL